jgi:hypothetical protein
MKKTIIAIITCATILGACKTPKKIAEPAVSCAGTNFLLQQDIIPILEKHCNSCHGYGGAGGYNFTMKEDIIKAAKNGDLLGTIKWQHGFPKMPARAEKLDQATIDKIECWVSNGMKE